MGKEDKSKPEGDIARFENIEKDYLKTLEVVNEIKQSRALDKAVESNWRQWSALVSTLIVIISLFTIYLFILRGDFNRLEKQITDLQINRAIDSPGPL